MKKGTSKSKAVKHRGLAVKITALVLVIAIISVCAIYLMDYYKADTETIEAFLPDVLWSEEKGGEIVVGNGDATRGLIFYPGGKVEHTAYVPLMKACAELGILCVIVEMPFRLAVFDVNAADGIKERYPQIESWYIGGHSLGGSMAASYLANNSDSYEGLILLGSYSTADLSDCGIRALSVYGSEDKVMNREKYAEYKENLPENFTELVIEGGCHAYFGMYGAQHGDGAPTVTNTEQIKITARTISDFTLGNN